MTTPPTRRLLVIDDSATIRKLLEISFRGTEFSLAFAATGKEGADRAGQSPHDVILLDYVLPDMRATDVVARLERDPASHSIPVLVMSGKTEGVRELFANNAAVVDFVAKPFDAQDILRRVRAAAARRAAPPPRAEPAKSLVPPAVSSAPAPMPAGLAIRGELSGWPVESILAQIEPHRTGELHLVHGGLRVIALVRAGEIVMVSCDDPSVFRRLDPAVEQAPAAALARASAEQRSSGKPLHVTLAEAMAIPPEDVGPALHRIGRALLLDACRASKVAFEWHDRAALPLHAEAYGRRIPVAQVLLDKLRAAPPSAAELEQGDAVFERAHEFSAKVQLLALTSEERRVLHLLDGRAPIDQLVVRTGIAGDEVPRALHRLARAGLVRKRRGPLAGRPLAGQPEPVLAVDPDAEGFLAPLGALLARGRRPLRLVSPAPDEDVAAAVLRVAPCLVMLNATALGERAERCVRAVRFAIKLARTPVVAVLEAPDPERTRELYEAGVNAVWIKPVRFGDVEAFLGS